MLSEAIKLAIEKGGLKWKTRNGLAITYLFRKDRDVYKVLIDKTDLIVVAPYAWHMTKKNGYAVAWVNGKRVRMHHLIMGTRPKGQEVDHINRNRIDNRRANLRFVTSLVNGQNTTAVGVRKHGKLWEANVCLNYKKHFKSFKTLKEAQEWRKETKAKFIKTL